MPSYAVFFMDPTAIGLQMVEAADAAAAEGMVLDQHPDAQVQAVDDALVTEENRHQLLAKWALNKPGQTTTSDLCARRKYTCQ